MKFWLRRWGNVVIRPLNLRRTLKPRWIYDDLYAFSKRLCRNDHCCLVISTLKYVLYVQLPHPNFSKLRMKKNHLVNPTGISKHVIYTADKKPTSVGRCNTKSVSLMLLVGMLFFFSWSPFHWSPLRFNRPARLRCPRNQKLTQGRQSVRYKQSPEKQVGSWPLCHPPFE